MRKAGIVLAASVVALAASVGRAAAADLVTVSGADPYAGCPDANQLGTVYPDAEVEPQVAVNPTTVGTSHVNVVGAWQQDR
jgi:hypothetical protein